jgi:hypothetical protein
MAMEKRFYYVIVAVTLILYSTTSTFAIGGGGDGSSTISVNKQGKLEIHTIAIEVSSVKDLDENNLQVFSANPNLVKVTNISVSGNIIQVSIDFVPTSKVEEDDEIIDVIEIVGIDNITGVFINPGGEQNTATAYVNYGLDESDEQHIGQGNQLSFASEMVVISNHYQVEQVPTSAPTSGSSVFVKDMLVYPNPAKDELGVVTVGEILGKSIQIMDMSGKVHKEIKVVENSHKTTIDITDLPAGIYLVNLTTVDGKSYIQKFYKVD